jgi:hypothetical protein
MQRLTDCKKADRQRMGSQRLILRADHRDNDSQRDERDIYLQSQHPSFGMCRICGICARLMKA